MDRIIKENKVKILIIFLILIALLIVGWIRSLRDSKNLDPEDLRIEDLNDEGEEFDNEGEVYIKENKVEIEEDISKNEELEEIMVHICGQVEKPGLIELEAGSRVKDAVNMAGGLKKEADLDNINLAKKLNDEDKIYIPKIGEEIDGFLEVSTDINDESSKLIDINKASKEELISLPGIGEKTAEKILDYRESNGFKSVDDLLDVPGIGPKKYEDLKNLIIVK